MRLGDGEMNVLDELPIARRDLVHGGDAAKRGHQVGAQVAEPLLELLHAGVWRRRRLELGPHEEFRTPKKPPMMTAMQRASRQAISTIMRIRARQLIGRPRCTAPAAPLRSSRPPAPGSG